MAKIFIRIYNYFANNKLVMYFLLVVSIAVMAVFSLRINYTEDIATFFPDSSNADLIFEHLESKDRIFVLITKDSLGTADTDSLYLINQALSDSLKAQIDTALIKNITDETSSSFIDDALDFVYANLPLLLDESDYKTIDSLITPEAIDKQMAINFSRLISPSAVVLSKSIFADPLGLANSSLQKLNDLKNGDEYNLQNNIIYSKDYSSTIMFISPKHPIANIKENKKLIEQIEDVLQTFSEAYPNYDFCYFGGPAVAVYNSKQVVKDSIITGTIAILLISLLLLFSFKSLPRVLIVILPAIYGILFALSLMSLITGSVSAIAAGAGIIILGIALSYSLHIVVHSTRVKSIQELIQDLAYPITIGSFTTIGAFLGLLFTSSTLLRDFGLFSALILIGTSLFSLIFLPHFISLKNNGNESKLYTFISKIAQYDYHKNKIFVISIILVFIVSLFFFNKVGFDSDMGHLNYMPEHIALAEKQLNNSKASNEVLIASGSNTQQAIKAYNELVNILKANDSIKHISNIAQFVISDSVQNLRIKKWQSYWTDDRVQTLINNINNAAVTCGIKPQAFNQFEKLLTSTPDKIDYKQEAKAFSQWINYSDSVMLLLAYCDIDKNIKDDIYPKLHANKDIMVADRSYYVNTFSEAINHDFNTALYISAILIFIALFISYGRIELALIAFAPMAISWVIILAIMYLLGIEFNIINIILSTFIFGLGDDYSIFIIDGILHEYKYKSKMLHTHKTAIFYSMLVTLIAMGVLCLAKHPAMYSISLVSTVGMLTVIAVAYAIHPIILKQLLSLKSKDLERRYLPYTVGSILKSLIIYLAFGIACIIINIYYFINYLVVPAKKREFVYSAAIYYTMRLLLKLILGKNYIKNPNNIDLNKQYLFISNHQSFLDIILMLSLNKRSVIITKNAIHQSPIFGFIARKAGFYNVGLGYEKLYEELQKKVDKGYSVIVFPEGTRSENQDLLRFNRGAFYLAQQLNLDIAPILNYGSGLVCPKYQPFNINKGDVYLYFLPVVKQSDLSFGDTYRQRVKAIIAYFKQEYYKHLQEYNSANNKYFRHALIKSYIYKGPVLEWYMRIKTMRESNYEFFDKHIPRSGYILDLGCGYAPMTYMLSILSPDRRILGLDYDQEKIALANANSLKTANTEFQVADLTQYELPNADTYLICDVLHYMNYEQQEGLIKSMIDKLNDRGKIIIRDGNSEDELHSNTVKTENWSTKIIGFNKTKNELYFTSTTRIKTIVENYNMNLSIFKLEKNTSNTIYLITK